jgi:hypothetical protein
VPPQQPAAADAPRAAGLTVLVPIVFIVALLFTLTGAVLETAAQQAKAGLDAAVARSADVALGGGVADFTGALARFVAANGTGGPWPQPDPSASRPACASAAAERCLFSYVVRATITAASSTSAATGADAASNLQAAVIDEQRVSAVVTVTLSGPSGTVLGTRTRFLTYRVFGSAPYAMVSGSRDLAADDGLQSAAAGDSGGAAGSQPAAASAGSQPAAAPAGSQPAVAPAGADDTRIHVRLTCRTVIANVVPFANDQQTAGNDALPWGNAAQAAYEVPCASPETPADAFRDEYWVNGTAGAPGWTQ